MDKKFKTANQVTTEKFEEAMQNLRAKRNMLLMERVIFRYYLNVTMNNNEYVTYRTKLRDITNGLTSWIKSCCNIPNKT